MANQVLTNATNSLENLITEVTSPLLTHVNFDSYSRIFELIKNDHTAPETALRILAHKVQSPQEKEAMGALTILDMCVQNCGPRFHSELGKFRFLNELIKILSPKHLGDSTSERVKSKCIDLFHTWNRDLGEKYPKISEAYQLLKSQGVIKEDQRTPSSAKATGDGEHTARSSLFENSRHAETLAKLLKSRNPDDLQKANEIIKSIVDEEDAKLERRSRRALEMKTLQDNTQLLEEMLKHVQPGRTDTLDAEVMQEIAAAIKKARPALFQLATSEETDQAEVLANIVDICGRASTVLERYEVVVLNKPPSTVQPAGTENDARPASDPSDTSHLSDLLLSDDQLPDEDLLTKELSRFGLQDAVPPRQRQQEAPHSNGQSSSAVPTTSSTTVAPAPSSNVDLLGDLLFSSPAESSPIKHPLLMPNNLDEPASQPCPPQLSLISTLNSWGSAVSVDTAEITTTTEKPSSPQKSSPSKLFGELDNVGRQMLGLTTTRSGSSLNSLAQAASEKKILSNSTGSSQILHNADAPVASPSPTEKSSTTSISESTNRVSLASLPELPLSAIQPHPVHTNPLLVYGDADGEHCVDVYLHYTGNVPAPGVRVFIAVVTSRNPLPITQVTLRLGVDKPCKLRQLSASADTLPAFCSFLPPSPIKQIIFVQHPINQSETPLKFQFSFTVDEEDVLESGQVSVRLD
uniref:ADP-ribosylation factor-binding protein GGA1 n=1 Tax=Schistocephalus solidus TaxID=70667 RepID=A0A0X3PPQ3_SCHSO